MDAPPIRLNVALFGGFEGPSSNLTARVQNIGFTKDVALHYNDGGNWTEVPLTWKSNFGSYDVFFRSEPKIVAEFALRYSIGGITFWDNDDGSNYHFAGRAAVIGGNASLKEATARRGQEAGGEFVFATSWIEGEIYVNNLSPTKEVGIRLSTDGGLTWKEVQASFSGPAAGSGAAFDASSAELWTFKSPELNLDPASDEFQFAVFHRNIPTGEEFWDNNFGQNYHVSKADGSVLA